MGNMVDICGMLGPDVEVRGFSDVKYGDLLLTKRVRENEVTDEVSSDGVHVVHGFKASVEPLDPQESVRDVPRKPTPLEVLQPFQFALAPKCFLVKRCAIRRPGQLKDPDAKSKTARGAAGPWKKLREPKMGERRSDTGVHIRSRKTSRQTMPVSER